MFLACPLTAQISNQGIPSMAKPSGSSVGGLNQRAPTQPPGLTLPQGSPGVPASLPDRYDMGRLSGFNEVHEYQIKDIQGRVNGLETTANWGKGAAAGGAVAFFLLLAFAKAFWKPIVRMLIHESGSHPPGTVEPSRESTVSPTNNPS